MPMELRNAVVLVSGAARGLGRAIAEAFADRQAHVAMVDVLEAQLERTAADLAARGATVLPLVADVTVPSQVDAAVARTESELGPIGILVNNAGTYSVIGPVWEADPQIWFRDVQVSLYGSFLCCHAVVGGMVERKRGCVINLISIAGAMPHPHSTSYACAKAGLIRLTEDLAHEVKDFGVTVFGLIPGAVRTDMTRFILTDPGGQKWRPEFGRLFDQGRLVPPERVGQLAVDLAGGKADALTGRYFRAAQDLDKVLAETDRILREDLLTVRPRELA